MTGEPIHKLSYYYYMLLAGIKESLRTEYLSVPILKGTQIRNGDLRQGKEPK